MRVLGLKLQHLQVVLARPPDVSPLLGIQVREGQMGSCLRWFSLQHLLQLTRGIRDVAGLLEREGEIVARIDRVGLDGERRLPERQRLLRVHRLHCQRVIILRISEGRISRHGELIS